MGKILVKIHAHIVLAKVQLESVSHASTRDELGGNLNRGPSGKPDPWNLYFIEEDVGSQGDGVKKADPPQKQVVIFPYSSSLPWKSYPNFRAQFKSRLLGDPFLGFLT